jgi:hypothetical protein
MKILIVQSAGKHPANAGYRECLCLKRGLDTLEGVQADVWGRGYPNYSTPLKAVVGAYNAVVVIENYHSEWIPDMTGITRLKLFWSIDSHIALRRHQQFIKNHRIDITLNSTAAYVRHFPKKCYWFPNAYDDTLVKPLNTPKLYNIGFCGNVVNRGKWIKQLRSTFKMKTDVMVIGDAMVRAVNSYKIHWNRNYSTDINYRTFETLGCRTVLLTNNTDRLKDLFALNKHLVIYKDCADCCNKIQWLLGDERVRNVIAEAGYNHVKANHTYRHRAERLVQIIKENI